MAPSGVSQLGIPAEFSVVSCVGEIGKQFLRTEWGLTMWPESASLGCSNCHAR